MHPAWYINGFFAYAMQGLLFWRGYRCGLYPRYPLFYAYLFYTTFWSVLSGIPSVTKHPAYPTVIWTAQLIAAVLRFGVAAEIFRHVFPRDSSLRRTAGTVVAIALMLTALLFSAIDPSPGSSIILDSLRRIVLSVAVWIVLVLGLAHYYRIRIGRNIWGMTFGITLFSGSELVYWTSVDLFPSLRTFWWNIHPIAYVCMLMIWTWGLWNYSPNPEIVPLEEMDRHRLLSAWRDRSAAIVHTLRNVLKP